MKKILCAILAVMMAVSMAACVFVPAGDEKPLSVTSPEGQGSPEETKQAETEPLVEETVLYEDESYKITATGMEESIWGTEIKLLLENSTDRNVVLSGDIFVVNGITMGGSLYLDAAAGKKANGEITLHTEELETAGVTDIAAVTVYNAKIYDSDNYDDLWEGQLEVKTSIAGSYSQKINDDGDVLWEGEGVTIISRVIEDSLFGHDVQLLIKNDTDSEIVVQSENVSVNGYTIDDLMSAHVVAGTVSYTDMTVMGYSLEENGIETIEDVSFTLNIMDTDYNTIAETGELTVYAAG